MTRTYAETTNTGLLDAHYLKLDASNGPVTGNLLVKPATDALSALEVQDKDANVILSVDSVNNRVGIGTTAPTELFTIDATNNIFPWSVRTGNTLYSHMVINPAGGVVGWGIFEGMYLAFQGTNNDPYPNFRLRNVLNGANSFGVIETNLSATPTDKMILALEPRGALWLYPLNGDPVRVVNTSVEPYTTATGSVGSSSKYWANSYLTRIYLNSTAYLDGATAGTVGVTGTLFVDGSTDVIQLRVQANATQTANLQTWENSSGGVLSSITGGGFLNMGNSSYIGASGTIHYMGSKSTALSGATNYGFSNQMRIAAASDSSANNYALFSQVFTADTDSNYSGELIGGEFRGTHTKGGTIGALRGLNGSVVCSGAGVATLASGLSFVVTNSGAGSITTGYGITVQGQQTNASGTLGTFYGVYINNMYKPSGGTINNQYGLYIVSQDKGSTNYAIYTNAGLVRFGDVVNTTGSYQVDGVQVVSNRVIDARIDDIPNSGDATTDGIIDAIQDCLIAHGLAAAA